ncbi:hypothetical protein [Streptomyces sasae]|uniref:hypothetical protein n=1 Tax=Streptomyces sasae TaxID=1266772 RepID=UPI00292D7230|nr:hypothetical protein [Streptomyces sasae]
MASPDHERGSPDRQARPAVRVALEQIAHRRGRKIATIVIARKLLTHADHLLREAEAAQKPKEPCTAG